MKPRINNPGFVRAIQDIVDLLPSEPPDQINADREHHGIPTNSLAAPARCVPGGATSAPTSTRTIPRSCKTRWGSSILPGSDDVYNSKTGAWETLSTGPNFAPNKAYLGWGVYVMATVDRIR